PPASGQLHPWWYLVMAEISSSSFDPVFDTFKCDVPEIPPISDIPFILDCEVPSVVTPIFDCTDIDLPIPPNYFVAILGATGVGGRGPTGDAGDPGNDGPPGSTGSDGCAPTVLVATNVICVSNPDNVAITVSVLETDDCEYTITYNFSVYCPFEEEATCCFWTWCPCEDESSLGPVDPEECSFSEDYCEDAPGQWVLQTALSPDGCVGTNPPCTRGKYHGQT